MATSEREPFDANIGVAVEWSYVECSWCRTVPSLLLQMDGGDSEDYFEIYVQGPHGMEWSAKVFVSSRDTGIEQARKVARALWL